MFVILGLLTKMPRYRINHTNHGWTYANRIDARSEGETVLGFYTSRYPHSTRETWSERISLGIVRLDGAPTSPDAVLSRGQRLTYSRPSWQEPDVPGPFAVLHEDDAVLAVAKPSGLPVLPGGNHLENTLLAFVRSRYGDDPLPAPVHRIGRATSGIVLFARTAEAGRSLSEDLLTGRIEKVYRALACGTDMPDRFDVETPIGRVPYPRIGTLHAAAPDGRPSHSVCRVLHRDRDNDRALLSVRILTGRPHQIRIHLAAAGHPLVGDPLYGFGGLPLPPPSVGRLPLPGDCGYHLHAHKVRFTHPDTGEAVEIVCQPPPLLRKAGD